MTSSSALVRAETHGSVLHLSLNRPKAINSLNLEMVTALHEHLSTAENDPSVSAVILSGDGDKGFCAGGDVKTVQLKTVAEGKEYARNFFRWEYAVDLLISEMQTPVIAIAHGISMGGGLGLFMGAHYRLVLPGARLAMPEVAIGFFPDVGASYFLREVWHESSAKMLALSGFHFTAEDALEIGCATHFINQPDSIELVSALQNGLAKVKTAVGVDVVHEAIISLLKPLSSAPTSRFAASREVLQRVFDQAELSQVIEAWQKEKAEDALLAEAWEFFERGSPFSQAVVWRQLQQSWDRRESATREWDMAVQMTSEPDFIEGVRAMLVDKDKNPHWRHSQVAGVHAREVDAIFEPVGGNLIEPF